MRDHRCCVASVENAQHFIYIENQYFISVKNQSANALFNRIDRAIRQNQTFRVVVLIPINSCGKWRGGPIKGVLK